MGGWKIRGLDGIGSGGENDADVFCLADRLFPAAALLSLPPRSAPAAPPPVEGSPWNPLYSFNKDGIFLTIGIACWIYGV